MVQASELALLWQILFTPLLPAQAHVKNIGQARCAPSIKKLNPSSKDPFANEDCLFDMPVSPRLAS